jgi:hypothetical protein
MFIFNGTATLINSTVASNSAVGSGGGIVNHGGLTLINSTVADNSASNEGGGISNQVTRGRVGAGLALTNSTVSGNSAGRGGGIWNEGEEFGSLVRLVNSTVTRNSATQGGGGIRVSFESTTILTNSLVAQNSAPTGPDVHNPVGPDYAGVVARFNLIGDGSGSGITDTEGNQVGSAAAPIDPLLAPLANYGGPTATHRLLPGSPAIDAASTPDCPSTDQRGVLRPQGPACDIGSFERVVP